MAAGITPKQLRQNTSVSSAGLQSLAVPVWVDANLDEVYCAIDGNFPNITHLDVGGIWNEDGLTLQDGVHEAIRVLSRGSFRHPRLRAKGKWLTMEAGLTQFIGFSNSGALSNLGIAIALSGASAYVYAGAYGETLFTSLIEITDLLPADYDTTEYVYGVNVIDGMVEVTINGKVVAVALYEIGNLDGGFLNNYVNELPYAMGGSRTFGLEASHCTVIGLKQEAPATGDKTLPFPPHHLWCNEGSPYPPRHYQVYKEKTATRWSNLATLGAAQTSHPIPVWGYTNVDVMFRSDAAGVLQVQAYVGDDTIGDWMDINNPGGVIVVPGLLYSYHLESIHTIIRLIYTPTNGDTIRWAEVRMSR